MTNLFKNTSKALIAALSCTVATGAFAQDGVPVNPGLEVPRAVKERVREGNEDLLKRIRLHQLQFWKSRYPALDLLAILELPLTEIMKILSLLEGWDGDLATLPDGLRDYFDNSILSDLPVDVPLDAGVVDELDALAGPVTEEVSGAVSSTLKGIAEGLDPATVGIPAGDGLAGVAGTVSGLVGTGMPGVGSLAAPELGGVLLPYSLVDSLVDNLADGLGSGSLTAPDLRTVTLPEGDGLGIPSPSAIVVPDLDAVSTPDLGGVAIPDLGSVSIPDLGSGAIPDIGSIAVPDLGSVGVPDLGGIDVPDIGSINVPDVGSVGVPDVGGLVGGVVDGVVGGGAPGGGIIPDVPLPDTGGLLP